MNLHEKEKLESIINQGYTFNFSDYLTKGLDIFKKGMGLFVGYTIVLILIFLVATLIPFLGPLAIMLITYPLIMGFAIVAHKVNQNEAFEFGTFFKGFDFIKPLLTQYLLVVIICSALVVPAVIYSGAVLNVGRFNPENVASTWAKVAIPVTIIVIPLFYLMVSWRWAPHFIVFYKMSAWEAMETSRKIIGKNFFAVLGLFLLTSLLGGLGAMALMIGVLFTYPLALCIDYAAFADVTRLLSVEDQDLDITEHFVE